MAGYRKNNFTGKSKKKLVRYDGFSLFGKPKANYMAADMSLNCDCVDGVLKTGIGLIDYRTEDWSYPMCTLWADVENIYSVKGGASSDGKWTEYLFLITGDDALYVYSSAERTWYQRLSMDTGAQVVTVSDGGMQTRSLVIGENSAYTFQEGNFYALPLNYTLAAVCECKGRAFVAVAPYTVVFSDPTSPWVFESSEEDGKICFPSGKGKIVDMVNFKDEVYIFFEYGIQRLRVSGTPKDFEVRTVAYGGSLIFGGSVGVCANAILFLTADGVYRLCNERAEKVCAEMGILPKREGQVCSHAVFGDKFLVRYLQENGVRKVAVLQNDGSYGYYASDLEGLSDCDGKALCRVNNDIKQVAEFGGLPYDEEYEFESEELDFGISGKKTLTGLKFEGVGSAYYRLWCDGHMRSGWLYFFEGTARIDCVARGEIFRLRLSLDAGTQIRAVTAEVVVAE